MTKPARADRVSSCMHHQVIEYVLAGAVLFAACGVGGVGVVGLIVWLSSKVWKAPRPAK